MKAFVRTALATALAALSVGATAATPLEQATQAAEASTIAWRRDIHAHPELGFKEVRTAKLVADHLKKLGLEVRTGVGGTGVVGVLRGGRPGPVVALRADMDALPVKEQTGLAFASKAKGEWQGKEVDVMHACGHDAHTAMLMGAAQVLAGLKAELPGTVVFLFQPAEELPPGGAKAMIADGALADPKVDAVIGVHVGPGELGSLRVNPGPVLAASDSFVATVHGRQTHGSMPWAGIDPITAAAQIITAWQTIPSRQMDLIAAPAPVLSVGSIHGGNRHNIIPDSVEMQGTLRTATAGQRDDAIKRVQRVAQDIARSAGATADVKFDEGGYPPTVNDAALVEKLRPAVQRAAKGGRALPAPFAPGAEDFSYFASQVPGIYLFLGTSPAGVDPLTAPPNHSPRFDIDESALLYGIRAYTYLALEFLGDSRR